MSSYETINLEITYHNVAIVQLNRPKKLNAMNDQFFNEFFDAVRKVRDDQNAKVLLIHGGDSRHFSAGLDLSAPSLFNKDGPMGEELGLVRRTFNLRSLIDRWQSAFLQLEKCEKPVIVCVHGKCIGGGVDLITACDIRLATADSSISLKEIDFAFAADLGSLQRLPKIISNDGRMFEWCLTGRKVDASEAAELGLFASLFADKATMMSYAMYLAQKIAQKPLEALRLTKMSLVHARDHSVSQGLSFIKHWNMTMLQSEEVEKRISTLLKSKL